MSMSWLKSSTKVFNEELCGLYIVIMWSGFMVLDMLDSPKSRRKKEKKVEISGKVTDAIDYKDSSKLFLADYYKKVGNDEDFY